MRPRHVHRRRHHDLVQQTGVPTYSLDRTEMRYNLAVVPGGVSQITEAAKKMVFVRRTSRASCVKNRSRLVVAWIIENGGAPGRDDDLSTVPKAWLCERLLKGVTGGRSLRRPRNTGTSRVGVRVRRTKSVEAKKKRSIINQIIPSKNGKALPRKECRQPS